ncbi:MAG: RNA polymerase sigma factor [Defluviitaleaceae bacterium]|nr:RNA polymerase sigma factor [Defluviitaleaceae bacterium]
MDNKVDAKNMTKHIEAMLDKTFPWAMIRTFSREEAEELTQEIMYQAIKSIGELKDPAKFEPWFWRLAHIQWQVFKRGKAKARNLISFNALPAGALAYEDTHHFIAGETYQNLRRRIAQMSAMYRDIIVMHYYDNLSCKTIAQKLGIPEGTVTYRLSVAREKLKKECSQMTETALKPAKLNIVIMGNFRSENDYPPLFISDALSQNILWHAYRQPRTIQELSIITGVPAVYIEDRVKNLIKREALLQPTKTTVQTDFLIFDDTTGSYGGDQVKDIIATLSDKFYYAAHALTEKTIASGMETAGRSFDEIMCFLSVMLLNVTGPDSAPAYVPGKLQRFPRKYDGYHWEYIGFKDGNSHNADVSMGAERSMNNFEHGKLAHYNFDFAPFTYRKYMFDYELDVCQRVLQGRPLDKKQQEIAAELIAKGFLAQGEDGGLTCTVPLLTKAQADLFARNAMETFVDVLPAYSQKLKEYVDGYVKYFPKHLKNAALMNGFYIFGAMFKAIANDWVARGKVTIPHGAVCDALVEM